MKKGVCPKCGSLEVYKFGGADNTGGIGWFGEDGKVTLAVKDNGWRPTWGHETTLCCNCGFYENYLVDNERLNNIHSNPEKAGWKKVTV